MSRSSSESSIKSFQSANERKPIDNKCEDFLNDQSTDGNDRCLLNENQDYVNKPTAKQTNICNVFKDHKYCLLIATIIFIVILSIFIIINYNRCELTEEHNFDSGNCTNYTKEKKIETKDYPSKPAKETEFHVTLWDTSMTVIIQSHGTLSLQLSQYDYKTTMMICRNNRTSYELLCNSQTKHNCQSVPVNKSVTIRNETQHEQITFNIVAKSIHEKIGIKWINN
ncbi:SLC6A4 [Mytilus coruscus]|uniref:SLC6A4 n=1 Tax=Mytilus coruscus TaxID=42192 RepID=A0A6J8D129_MYTCO|nr:SLC6A4 [Mytilus coruscus]